MIEKVFHIVASPGQPDPYGVVQREIGNLFFRLTPHQLQILCFYVLSEIARAMAATDDSGELTKDRQMKLQQMMDQKSQAESSLSHILKALETTQSDPVGNLE